MKLYAVYKVKMENEKKKRRKKYYLLIPKQIENTINENLWKFTGLVYRDGFWNINCISDSFRKDIVIDEYEYEEITKENFKKHKKSIKNAIKMLKKYATEKAWASKETRFMIFLLYEDLKKFLNDLNQGVDKDSELCEILDNCSLNITKIKFVKGEREIFDNRRESTYYETNTVIEASCTDLNEEQLFYIDYDNFYIGTDIHYPYAEMKYVDVPEYQLIFDEKSPLKKIIKKINRRINFFNKNNERELKEFRKKDFISILIKDQLEKYLKERTGEC